MEPPNKSEGPQANAPQKIRIRHLQHFKETGGHFAMLTAYDANIAEIFDKAGIEALLVGDSAANTVYARTSTLDIKLEEIIPLTRAVAVSARRALVVADLPFGSYQVSAQQAVQSSIRLMQEGLAHAVKLEGGASYAPHIKAIVQAGIPVIAHIGFTPQSEHALSGFRVQGREKDAAQRILKDARAVEEAGASAVLLEMVTAEVAGQVDASVAVPTIGIGAGSSTTGQVLVWQDMLGLSGTKVPRFVKQYADLRSVITYAAQNYAAEVKDGVFPGVENSF